jgi:Sec-independent protein translocase protein TatA
MNFGFSGEMIFLFFLALILFGPKKMPEIGRQVARILGEFRRASNEFRSQIESEVNSLDVSGKPGNNARQQILPSFQAPLGSLASRILNPPPPEKLEAMQDAAMEAAAVQAAAAESVSVKAAADPVPAQDSVAAAKGIDPSPAPISPAPKVAPDA